MKVTSYSKYVRTSSKKLQLIAATVRKMPPQQVLDRLFLSRKKSAKILYKSIKSALDNAVNTFKLDQSMLQFKVLAIEEGPRLKRFRRGSRGTAKPYIRPTAHIKIVLIDKA